MTCTQQSPHCDRRMLPQCSCYVWPHIVAPRPLPARSICKHGAVELGVKVRGRVALRGAHGTCRAGRRIHERHTRQLGQKWSRSKGGDCLGITSKVECTHGTVQLEVWQHRWPARARLLAPGTGHRDLAGRSHRAARWAMLRGPTRVARQPEVPSRLPGPLPDGSCRPGGPARRSRVGWVSVRRRRVTAPTAPGP